MSIASDMGYTQEAIDFAKNGAEEWLEGNGFGHPRTWEQELKDAARRGCEAYEKDFEAPPIAGYEALEAEGKVVRGEIVLSGARQNRVRFDAVPPETQKPPHD